MTYKLEFKRSALKEWNKLGSTLQQQLKKKLAERLKTPHVAPDRVLGADNVYKIKLRQSGYRLVYQVLDDVVFVSERLDALVTCDWKTSYHYFSLLSGTGPSMISHMFLRQNESGPIVVNATALTRENNE